MLFASSGSFTLHMIPTMDRPPKSDTAVYPTPMVGALIVDQNRRLLLLKSNGRFGDRWVVPTGKIVRNEGLIEALRREIRRETTLEIERIRFLGVREQVTPAAHFLLIEYGAIASTTDVVPGVEYADARWFTRSEISALDLADFTRKLIYEHSLTCLDLISPGTDPTPGSKLRIG